MINIDMEWEKLKELFFEQGNVQNSTCPECGGRVVFSCDRESGSYTMQCEKCYTMIRGHREKAS